MFEIVPVKTVGALKVYKRLWHEPGLCKYVIYDSVRRFVGEAKNLRTAIKKAEQNQNQEPERNQHGQQNQMP